MTGPRRIVVEVERIVLEGIHLDAAGVDAARTAIVDGLSLWLAALPPSTLQSLAMARTNATLESLPSSPDGQAIGAGIAGAIREAVSPMGGEAP